MITTVYMTRVLFHYCYISRLETFKFVFLRLSATECLTYSGRLTSKSTTGEPFIDITINILDKQLYL